jgi:hypothetical protein
MSLENGMIGFQNYFSGNQIAKSHTVRDSGHIADATIMLFLFCRISEEKKGPVILQMQKCASYLLHWLRFQSPFEIIISNFLSKRVMLVITKLPTCLDDFLACLELLHRYMLCHFQGLIALSVGLCMISIGSVVNTLYWFESENFLLQMNWRPHFSFFASGLPFACLP